MRACRWSDTVSEPLVRSAPEEPGICPFPCKLVQIFQTAEDSNFARPQAGIPRESAGRCKTLEV